MKISELAALAAQKHNAEKLGAPPALQAELFTQIIKESLPSPVFKLNEQQQAFVDAICSPDPKPVILIGPAGTGKTTAVGKGIAALMQSGRVGSLKWAHKHLPGIAPSFAVCAFTRRATNRARTQLPEDVQGNCCTFHKLIEFEPEYFEVTDPETGDSRTSMRFTPSRDSTNPLPSGMTHIFCDESTMLGSDLWAKVVEALPRGIKVIFIGDLWQLPPVMDKPALSPYLINDDAAHIIELTQIYRTALDNPIIKYATQIRRGVGFPISKREQHEATETVGRLTFMPWKDGISEDSATRQLGLFFKSEYESGNYDPVEHQVLIPWNKRLGSIELNKWIATWIARKHNKFVHHVLAGFEHAYFAEGDQCIFDKQDVEILEIEQNPAFTGTIKNLGGVGYDYWGSYSAGHDPHSGEPSEEEQEDSEHDALGYLLGMTVGEPSEDRVKQASHKIKVRYKDTGTEAWLTSAGDINKLDLSYVMTIHKAQGSEWPKVYLIFHKVHDVSLNRELLYTGFTRAKQELFVICAKDTFQKGVTKQAIQGNTLAEKISTLKRLARLENAGFKAKQIT